MTDEFIHFLDEKVKTCKASANKALGYIWGVLWLARLQLGIWSSALLDKFTDSEMNTNLSHEAYFKHLKRSLIIDLWSVTEIRIREMIKDENIGVKSRNASVCDLLTAARATVTDEAARRMLKKAQKQLTGRFVEFPSCLSALLKHHRLDSKERIEWQAFFDIFRTVRNSVHDNFTCTETRVMRYKEYERRFIEGQPIELHFDDLKLFIEDTIRFFETIERAAVASLATRGGARLNLET